MGAFGWGTDHPVEEWLFEEGYRFDFFQAVRLLEMIFSDGVPVGEGDDPEREVVRFKAQADLTFPATDVGGISRAVVARPALLPPAPPARLPGDVLIFPAEDQHAETTTRTVSSPPQNGHQPATMTVRFMGLAGHLGPLPAHYTELIMDRAWKQDTAFRDFLDIFNHRLVSLLYRIRKHHHIGLEAVSPEKSHVASYLYALAGMGTPGLQGLMAVDERALLRHTGLLTQKPRSAVGLEAMLEGYFQVPVHIRQLVGRWRPLEDHQTTRIASPGANHSLELNSPPAQNNSLGQNTVLGTRVWRQASQFDLHLGPLALPDFLGFLPDGGAHRALSELTQFYVNRETDFNVVLKLKPEEVPSSRLGTLMGARLGWTSWLSRPAADGFDDRSDESGQRNGSTLPADFEVTLTPRFLSSELQKLRIPLFAELSPDQFLSVLRTMQRHRLPEETVIAREGDPATSFFIINTGSVHLLRVEPGQRDVIFATLGEGDFFGEATLQENKQHSITFVTAEPSEILELTHKKLHQAMEHYPAIERAVEVYRRKKGLDGGAHPYAKLAQKLHDLRSPLFAELSMEGLCEVAERITLFGVLPGTTVVRQDDPGTALYIISRGTARVDVRRPDGQTTTVATLREGDFFGEMALLYSAPRNATVTTTSPAEVIVLTRKNLARIIARYPPIEHALRVFYHRRFAELARAGHGA